MSLNAYRMLTTMAAPLLPVWMAYRKAKGKEDSTRIRERYGIASKARPPGNLLWLHAASVGEANSVLLLIQKIQERFLQFTLLLTTGTVTSAQLMQHRLPKQVIHQYAPLDTPSATARFIAHWKPDIGLWVESELWPNLIIAADESQCFLGIVNARMSERSFASWQKRPALIRSLLQRFNLICAQSENDAIRLEKLGAKDVLMLGNLKYDAALLPCDEVLLVQLQKTVNGRPLWLAASTHPGEEDIVVEAHGFLAATRPGLLTVIVPRHPERGAEIAQRLQKNWRVALRSRGDVVQPATQIYIADTLGELGLFYRLCEIVFMGGSLVKHGGQNPLEPARLACAILTGTHTHNFNGIYADMEAVGACIRVQNAATLANQIGNLLASSTSLSKMQTAAKQWVEQKSGTAERLLEFLAPILAPRSLKRAGNA